MNISTNYAVGDVVYVVVEQKVCNPVACDVCASTGKVTIGEVEYTCPACMGRKVPTGEKEIVARDLTIKRITALVGAEGASVFYDGALSCGRLFVIDQASVFATQAEAEASIGG